MVLLPCLTTAHYMHFKSYKSEEESSEEKSSPSQEEKSSPKTASEEDDSKMKEMSVFCRLLIRGFSRNKVFIAKDNSILNLK